MPLLGNPVCNNIIYSFCSESSDINAEEEVGEREEAKVEDRGIRGLEEIEVASPSPPDHLWSSIINEDCGSQGW